MHIKYTLSYRIESYRIAISYYRHRSVPVPYENGSVETTVAKEGQKPGCRIVA